MATTKHPITKDEDGNGFTYRGQHVRVNLKHYIPNYRYVVPFGPDSLKAKTKAGILAAIDKYHHDAEVGWTPVRKGAVYCSPRCGHKCTHADFLAAKARAAALCKQLGAGWTPNVWENGGWHASAKNGVAEMHTPNPKREDTEYGLYFNTVRQIVIHGTDPQALVIDATVESRRIIAQMASDTDAIEPGRRNKPAANDSTKPRRKAA